MVKTAFSPFGESFDNQNGGKNSLQNTSKMSTMIPPIMQCPDLIEKHENDPWNIGGKICKLHSPSHPDGVHQES